LKRFTEPLQSTGERPVRHLAGLGFDAPALHVTHRPTPVVSSHPRKSRLTEPQSLEALVTEIANRPDLWEHHVDRTGDKRSYACLRRDTDVDVWVIFWRPGTDTGWHDHDVSSGAVHVVEGTLVAHALRVGGPERQTEHHGGECFSFDPSHIHRMTCASDIAVSIHAYSPPLWRLGQYTVEDDGTLHRVSVSYADELRPLEAAA
jgi:predicted metal-dependent enzyme (double-stranded beta helix superfamily)